MIHYIPPRKYSICSRLTLAYLILVSHTAWANNVSQAGHIKYRFNHTAYPDSSAYYDIFKNSATDQSGSFRYNFDWSHKRLSLDVDYEAAVIYGDTYSVTKNLPDTPLTPSLIPSDENRLMNLTQVMSEDEDFATVQRLDRIHINYQDTYNVVKVGRQVISWGNGLFYAPMDFFNPFDPAAIDKEYKTGDDIVYGQRLFKSGNDLQLVWVGRRDDNGDIAQDVQSTAVKYHRFVGANEVDILISYHYDDLIIGTGGILNLGGGILRGDLVATDTDTDLFTSLSVNYSYSWNLWQKNMSGMMEYFYNGFGIQNGDYSPTNLAAHPDLFKRLSRGELFNLGQNYLATSVSIEMTPLWMLSPNIFMNLSDQSALLQLSSRNDLSESVLFLAALNIPVGANGTEYGGIETVDNTYLKSNWTLFAQLAWYF